MYWQQITNSEQSRPMGLVATLLLTSDPQPPRKIPHIKWNHHLASSGYALVTSEDHPT